MVVPAPPDLFQNSRQKKEIGVKDFFSSPGFLFKRYSLSWEEKHNGNQARRALCAKTKRFRHYFFICMVEDMVSTFG